MSESVQKSEEPGRELQRLENRIIRTSPRAGVEQNVKLGAELKTVLQRCSSRSCESLVMPDAHLEHQPARLTRTLEANYGEDNAADLAAEDIDAALHDIAMRHGLREFLRECETRRSKEL